VPATRAACIDVGSNTTALLVADVSPEGLIAVETRRVFTMLGSDASPSGISAAKIDEVISAIKDLLALAESHGGADNLELVATHVVREAHNGHELAAAVLEATGHRLEMVDGHEEARFSFIGATGGLDRLRGTTVAIDAGGGSTEIAVCEPGGQPWTASVHIGSALIAREYLTSDPPTAEQTSAAIAAAGAAFDEIELPTRPYLALVVGGGASTASQLSGGVLDAGSIARVLQITNKLSSAELAERHRLDANRAKLLPAGLSILSALVERLGVGLEVGRGGLREGLLIDRHAA
jgi:exopolyphosphatase/guanosine-5'-triphosphate,3'-diphosphate pyrophosphatase